MISALNPEILTTVGAALGIVIASWTILSNFDKRNSDRFDSLQRQMDALGVSIRKEMDALATSLRKEMDAFGSSVRKEIEATRDTLRAEMREMRAELRLEIKEAADRRIVRS